MEGGDQVRFGSLQGGHEDVAEEPVVPVPLATAIERDEEQVGGGEFLQHLRGPACIEHRITERAAEVFQDRRTGEKRDRDRREVRQHLGAEVVGDEDVVAGERQLPACGRVV